jgi:hypothetical protein
MEYHGIYWTMIEFYCVYIMVIDLIVFYGELR